MRSKGTLWWPLRRTSLRGGVAFASVGIESGCRRRNWAVAIRIKYTWICLFSSWILFFYLLVISLVSVESQHLSHLLLFSNWIVIIYTYTHWNIYTTYPYIIYILHTSYIYCFWCFTQIVSNVSQWGVYAVSAGSSLLLASITPGNGAWSCHTRMG